MLATTMLALGSKQVPFVEGPAITPLHDAAYWQRVTAAFDFSEADQVPPARFNRVLWNGLMGDRPYPIRRGGAGTSKTH